MRGILILALIGLVSACGGDEAGDNRSGTGDLEPHCRAWCDPETGCSDSTGTAKQCLDSCMASAEQDPCFDHVVTYQECLLSMECVDPFEDCEAPRDLPRMSGEPICESFDNAYARCTCEHRYDGETGGTGGTGGTGTSQTAIALCDEMCGWPDECFVALGVPLQGAECTEECLASVEVVGVDCLGAIVDTVDCIGTCDVESITEEQALACQDESEAVSLACE